MTQDFSLKFKHTSKASPDNTTDNKHSNARITFIVFLSCSQPSKQTMFWKRWSILFVPTATKKSLSSEIKLLRRFIRVVVCNLSKNLQNKLVAKTNLLDFFAINVTAESTSVSCTTRMPKNVWTYCCQNKKCQTFFFGPSNFEVDFV